MQIQELLMTAYAWVIEGALACACTLVLVGTHGASLTTKPVAVIAGSLTALVHVGLHVAGHGSLANWASRAALPVSLRLPLILTQVLLVATSFAIMTLGADHALSLGSLAIVISIAILDITKGSGLVRANRLRAEEANANTIGPPAAAFMILFLFASSQYQVREIDASAVLVRLELADLQQENAFLRQQMDLFRQSTPTFDTPYSTCPVWAQRGARVPVSPLPSARTQRLITHVPATSTHCPVCVICPDPSSLPPIFLQGSLRPASESSEELDDEHFTAAVVSEAQPCEACLDLTIIHKAEVDHLHARIAQLESEIRRAEALNSNLKQELERVETSQTTVSLERDRLQESLQAMVEARAQTSAQEREVRWPTALLSFALIGTLNWLPGWMTFNSKPRSSARNWRLPSGLKQLRRLEVNSHKPEIQSSSSKKNWSKHPASADTISICETS
eukprot:m.170020 g.170020  ORF g.170020 m.170020 type:complete len:449 (+) comp53242_c0_seq1:101-1447(+)